MPPINAEKRYIPALRNRGVREDRKSLMGVSRTQLQAPEPTASIDSRVFSPGISSLLSK